ncbi:MAG TPA: IS1595 family transposase [Casimicrobiaceae bacterium]|jgi:transposase-like protein|nr:IS1595 family transposase [Casimicrobiaceae bacterium]
MAKALFDAPQYRDPDAAREHLESIRWPKGPVCPHCGAVDRITKLQGKSHRSGLYDCGHCRDQFTVTVGTVFERSKISLDKWLFAAALMASSKKGISSKQIERMLGVTYKTAWFITHRLREAMGETPSGKLGGGGKIVEVDETYFGNKEGAKKRSGKVGGAAMKDKRAIVALVERGGKVRSYHVPGVTHANLKEVMFKQIDLNTHLMTDEATRYWNLGKEFAKHSSVNHGQKEYARGEVSTNTVEGYFSILKRGLIGTYQHVGERHLHRYIREFDFRYNHRIKLGYDDATRTTELLKGVSGKRLTYRRIGNGA